MEHSDKMRRSITTVLIVVCVVALSGVAGAYQATVDVAPGNDVVTSGDITARARALTLLEDTSQAKGEAEYVAKVNGDDWFGPNQTGGAVLLNAQTIDITWVPDDEPDAHWQWSATYDFVPSGTGQTIVGGNSTIYAEYTIKMNGYTVVVGGVDESPSSSQWPTMFDSFTDTTLQRPAPAPSSIVVAGQTAFGPPPDVEASASHNVNAWWTGSNLGGAVDHHKAAIDYKAKATLLVEEPHF